MTADCRPGALLCGAFVLPLWPPASPRVRRTLACSMRSAVAIICCVGRRWPQGLFLGRRAGCVVRHQRRFLPGSGGGRARQQGRGAVPSAAARRAASRRCRRATIDVLSRNVAITSSLDTALGIRFPGVLVYDGQGFHGAQVRRASPARSSCPARASA